MSDAQDQLREEIDRFQDARRRFHRRVAEILPVGASIWYRHGRHLIGAEVVGHTVDELRVEGFASGKVYWIKVSRVESCEVDP